MNHARSHVRVIMGEIEPINAHPIDLKYWISSGPPNGDETENDDNDDGKEDDDDYDIVSENNKNNGIRDNNTERRH